MNFMMINPLPLDQINDGWNVNVKKEYALELCFTTLNHYQNIDELGFKYVMIGVKALTQWHENERPGQDTPYLFSNAVTS